MDIEARPRGLTGSIVDVLNLYMNQLMREGPNNVIIGRIGHYIPLGFHIL